MGRERKANWAEMMGEAVREPEFSHSYGGEDYFCLLYTSDAADE